MYLHVVVIAARGLEDCAITRRRRRAQCSLSLSLVFLVHAIMVMSRPLRFLDPTGCTTLSNPKPSLLLRRCKRINIYPASSNRNDQT